jgi:hypothetical protein
MLIRADNTSTGPITADLESIEDNIFTPICSKCHIGASAPEGLQLDGAHAYNAIVGVPSVEEPQFLRVDPGNPDQSYLMLEIENAMGIEGGQMPLGENPLLPATMDALPGPHRPGGRSAGPKKSHRSRSSLNQSRRSRHSVGMRRRPLAQFARARTARRDFRSN